MRTDIYDRVTQQIIAELEKGVRPWLKPWSSDYTIGRITRPLRSNGIPYRGINILLLWSAACACGFASPHWFTFKQAQALGAHVRKGERGSLVVFASTLSRSETNAETGEETAHDIPFLKNYTVFNADQIDALPREFHPSPVTAIATVEPLAHAKAFFAATRADIRSGGAQAYYSLSSDHVQMPLIEAFRNAESHAATLAHELTHWTRHPNRLDRDLGRKRWGDAGYAMEELVAELGAAFLCADLAITSELRDDHAAYVASWIKVLKNDTRAIFTAAAHAQKAADYLHSLQPAAQSEPLAA